MDRADMADVLRDSVPSARASATSVDAAEVARFAALAGEWWNPDGNMRPLHRLNPVRIAYLRDRIAAHFGRAALGDRPLTGLRIVDIGCGGGLLSEPMARLGATVSGIDAAEPSIAVARTHAAAGGLAIDYRCTTVETLAASGAQFDVVLNMEVVEHVADRDAFLDAAATLVAPGGLTAISTLNRTTKAWLLAIVGGEYVLRWLPRGTHDWHKFVRPSEIAAAFRRSGLTLTDLSGVVYDPLGDRWRLSTSDLDVNYMAMAARPVAPE